MSTVMEEEIKRWTARQQAALVLEIIQGKTTVANVEQLLSKRERAAGNGGFIWDRDRIGGRPAFASTGVPITFERVYEERFERAYGFYRPYLRSVIYRYLDCGVLGNGFARVRCGECGHEYLLAFSCKRRHFCPSCHQKRVVEFGEWLCGEVLKRVPYRHFVFSIPKILRRYFLYDRSLLSELSRCAWEALRVCFREAVPQGDAMPGAIITIQTFGDFGGFNPHCHVLCTDGCFDEKGLFRVAPRFNPEDLRAIFEHHVFQMLLGKGEDHPRRDPAYSKTSI